MNIWNKITDLGRLKLSKEEEKLLVPQVRKIIEFFNNISHIPTKDLEPLISPVEKPIPLRFDKVQTHIPPEQLLSQTKQENQYVQVPLVISAESDQKEN